MKSIPRISETEWEIMRVLWAAAPRTAAEVVDALVRKDPSWHPKTIKTFLTRLVNKGALEYQKDGRAYLYLPLVTERECVDAASDSFLDRVFGGSLKPMLAHFVEQKKLSAKEIQDLRKLLEQGVD